MKQPREHRASGSPKPLIFNATPILYLCKIGASSVFMEISEEKYTTPKVIEEVVDKGKSLGASDAFIAEQLIERSVIRVRRPRNADFIDQILRISDLHRAEAEVLALAKELNGVAIVDESAARQVARIYNVRAHGTAYVLLRLVYEGKLSMESAREVIDKMISTGWRLTAEEYAKLMKELKSA